LRQDRRVQTGMTLCWRDEGIDKLTRRRGPALLDEDLSAQYVDASAHSERILRSEEARRSHVPVAEFVNLSVPGCPLRSNTVCRRNRLTRIAAAFGNRSGKTFAGDRHRRRPRTPWCGRESAGSSGSLFSVPMQAADNAEFETGLV